MMTFPLHTEATAPAESVSVLTDARAKFGFLPNLLGEFAESPAALRAYLGLSQAFSQSSLSPIEQQVVLLSTSIANGCTYCVAAHSAMVAMAGLPADQLKALREQRALANPRLEALRALTVEIVTKRGWPAEPVIQAFLRAFFTQAQYLEILVGVAQKTLSNYMNHAARTPLDTAFQQFAWQPAEATTHA